MGSLFIVGVILALLSSILLYQSQEKDIIQDVYIQSVYVLSAPLFFRPKQNESSTTKKERKKTKYLAWKPHTLLEWM